MARMKYGNFAPEGFAMLGAFSKYIMECGLEESLIHMVYLRVSQINGCPYCVDSHWKDAISHGEDARKLNAVIIWRDAPFFSPREMAALRWAEVVTTLPDQHVSEEEYAAAKAVFNDKELVNLTYAIGHMNSMNRIAIAFHLVPVAAK